MAKKKVRAPKENRVETPSLGIPESSLAEKIDSVVPVKLQPSLKRAIPKPQSSWIRQAIMAGCAVMVAVTLIFFVVFAERSPLLTALGFGLIFSLLSLDLSFSEGKEARSPAV